MRVSTTLTAGLVSVVASGSLAQDAGAARWFAISPAAIFETGDSWTEGGVVHRLYGVQACLRGTSFTNASGVRRDCGEASLAMLVALIRDLQPQCHRAAAPSNSRTVFVFCVATRSGGAGAGSRIDLGTAMIASGFGFASLATDGRPVHQPYFVAQQVAARAKAGLWAYPDTPEPNAIILRSLRDSVPMGSPNLTAPR
ncbi:thermonuclease family protein (plasmid) [Bosea vestrisii]|uniref:thermonuclease family protein n=1 Tax=Bosea vestrisii TaxID=151416 RepID=UPI0024DFA495|nr:thermonuclease family protein [Bosea vestrisii]WID99753.1 thermonuclease family protein [Bosea vestrisii]